MCSVQGFPSHECLIMRRGRIEYGSQDPYFGTHFNPAFYLSDVILVVPSKVTPETLYETTRKEDEALWQKEL